MSRPASRSLAPELEAIQSTIRASYGIDLNELLSSRGGMSNDARNLVIHLARRLSGQTRAIIREAFGLEHYSGVGSVVSRTKQGLASNRSLGREMEAIERGIQ